MGKIFRIIHIVTIFLLCITIFTACGETDGNITTLPTPSVEKTENSPPIDKKLPDLDKDEQNEVTLYFEDEERLVRVALEDGEASISFNGESWNETYGFQRDDIYFVSDTMQDEYFPIRVKSGNVIDVCIARVLAMGPYSPMDGFVLPIVVLLMDDGSIEWLYASPNIVFDSGEFGEKKQYYIDTYEKLAYRDNFVSFSCVSSGEGFKDKRIYAINSHGDRYNFFEMYLENQLYDTAWMCELEEDSLYGYLKINKDGSADFSISGVKYVDLSSSDIFQIWAGTTNYVKSPDHHLPLGTLTFDMVQAIEPSVDGQMLPRDMQGSYQAEITRKENGQITLYHSAGDKLYPSSGETLVFDAWFYGEHLYEDGIEGEMRQFYAYIRDSDLMLYDWPQFEFDDVEWISDINEPNDYRLENSITEWVNYTTTEDTIYTIFNYDRMESEFLDIYELSDYLRNWPYDDYMIVCVTVADGTVESIEEVYRP